MEALGLAALALQIFLLLLLAAGWWRLGREHPYPTTDASMPISVVVCMHNEAANAWACLQALLAQQYPYFEVIVVDDRSTDETPAILQHRAALDARIRILTITQLPTGWTGKKHALQAGTAHAQFEHLAFTDADCQVPPTWLRHIAAQFTKGKALVLGYSPYRAQPGLLNFFIRYDAAAIAAQYLGWAAVGLPYMAVGRNLAYTKQVWRASGGVAQHAATPSGDDDILVSRARPRQTPLGVLIDPASHVSSNPKTSWGAYLRQKARHLGASFHYGPKAQLLIGTWGASQWAVWLSIAYTGVSWLAGTPPGSAWLGMLGAWAMLKTLVWLAAGKRLQMPIMAAAWPLAEPLQLLLQMAAVVRYTTQKRPFW